MMLCNAIYLDDMLNIPSNYISENKEVLNARLDKKIHPKGRFLIKILLLECLLGYTRVDENHTKLNVRMWLSSSARDC